MKIIDFFDQSFFINLNSRPERREHFESELRKVQLENFVQRFPASIDATHLPKDDYNRHRACGKSHHDLIKYAKNNNLKNILIFEDDAYFYNDGEKPALNIIEEALDHLKELEWDVFYLGGLIIDKTLSQVSPNLLSVETVLTCHAWAINHTGYDKILKYVPEKDSAIDGWIGNRSFIKKYLAYPLAVPQKHGKSDLDAFGWNPGLGPYLECYKKPIVKK